VQLGISHSLYIDSLQVTDASERSLSIAVRLSGDDEGQLQLLHLVFTLTAVNGAQVGGMEVTIGRKTRGLTIEMPLPARLRGTYRLKASLCAGETVIDDARIDIVL
jgi:hypothetical protein